MQSIIKDMNINTKNILNMLEVESIITLSTLMIFDLIR